MSLLHSADVGWTPLDPSLVHSRLWLTAGIMTSGIRLAVSGGNKGHLSLPRRVLVESQTGKDKMEMGGIFLNLYLHHNHEYALAKSSHTVSSESEEKELYFVNAKDFGVTLRKM